jgi:hypothetical protein
LRALVAMDDIDTIAKLGAVHDSAVGSPWGAVQMTAYHNLGGDIRPADRRASDSGSAPGLPLAADFDRFDFFRVVVGYRWNLIGIDTHLYGCGFDEGAAGLRL